MSTPQRGQQFVSSSVIPPRPAASPPPPPPASGAQPSDRQARLERIAVAADAWLLAWQTSQADGKTHVAFEASKRLAAAVRS